MLVAFAERKLPLSMFSDSRERKRGRRDTSAKNPATSTVTSRSPVTNAEEATPGSQTADPTASGLRSGR